MSVERAKGDNRRYPRWPVGGRLTGRIAPTLKVYVLDISRRGALVEHPSLLQRGVIVFVNLLFPAHEVDLKCRVARSDAHHYEVLPTGVQDLVCRTGLEFLDISEASDRLIGGYIEFLKGSIQEAKTRASP